MHFVVFLVQKYIFSAAAGGRTGIRRKPPMFCETVIYTIFAAE